MPDYVTILLVCLLGIAAGLAYAVQRQVNEGAEPTNPPKYRAFGGAPGGLFFAAKAMVGLAVAVAGLAAYSLFEGVTRPWLPTLLAVSAAGGFIGLVYATDRLVGGGATETRQYKALRGTSLPLFLLAHALTGIVAGVGLFLIAQAWEKIQELPTPTAKTGVMVCVAGAAGGLVYGLYRLIYEGKDDRGNYVASGRIPLRVFFLANVLLGMGGALAVLLVYLWAKEPKVEEWTAMNWLFLTALSFVGGFAGYRILPLVAQKLEEELAKKAEQKAEQAQQKAESVELPNRILLAMSDLAVAKRAFSAESKDALQQHAKVLEGFRAAHPLDRKLHIVLARIYRTLADHNPAEKYDRAIKVLSDFLGNKEKAGQATDNDAAAALFNRACYDTLQALRDGDEASKTADLRKAVQDLKSSIQIFPDYANQAAEDDDLKKLAGTAASEEFRKLTGEGPAPK